MNKKTIEELEIELKISKKSIETVLKMLNQGNTVPFISRYRKEQTGGLNEEQVYEIEKRYKYVNELLERQESIINILKEKGLLTKEIENSILSTKVKSDLEAIYEPFKIGKVTKATTAIKLGLEPLAKLIYDNKNPNFNKEKEAEKYLNDNISTVEFALEQANFIIAQWISQNVQLKTSIKEQILKYGLIATKLKKNATDEGEKFKIYYDKKTPIKYIKNHNILAINRAAKLKIITITFEYNQEYLLKTALYYVDRKQINRNNILEAVNDSLKRLILPSIEREIFSDLFSKAEESSINIFANSVEKLLKAPATQDKVVLAIDPGYANGCKMAVLNPNGDFITKQKMFPHKPQEKTELSKKIVLDLIRKHNIDIVVIGNGTASRETEKFIADLVKENKLTIKWTIVSEVGASIYSASKVAIEEFPDMSVEERSAINIGRKFIDPLNELVKIDPKSIGVGQYQHDVNQKELENFLTFKVQKVVNEVGVDINTATKSILTYISGLNSTLANNIIDFRKEIKYFSNRNQLKKVKGIGDKTFEQSIGFLRIFNSDNYLDKTFIHPESYKLANKIIEDYNLEPNENGIDISFLDINTLVQKYNSNKFEIEMILDAFKNPLKKIDNNKSGFLLKDSIVDLEQLKTGSEVVGTIENITDFGIFVYIGIKQTLFIHLNDLNLPNNVEIFDQYYPGTTIKATILNIEKDRNRLSGKIA
ncbi:helix-hairpin-helix domain-containing protein [Mycoplasma sp. CSL7503-lung]|uniref:helix-hairpin-helix domain-containing protein n=1 Tax=Mycoplasma sp. CSL7503-lung TaxID=536372 RepID=UPI0021D37D49|nr:Tex-like N-terminal domain-containing protein [Mycoplasma sp. CSL7503-lung]MCU4706639.1 helix-hairpin-helix domain-containing protein [Mycoplasma sp. CSL7503-lung]